MSVRPSNFRPYRWAWLIALIVAILIIAAPTLTYPLGRDQGEFAIIGRGLLDGRVPYVDLWNPKPPAVFYVYAGAMALFGRSVPALRAIDLILFPILAASLYWIGRRIDSDRVGWWAALLFGVFYFTETFWTLTQNDGIALLPMTLAVVCMIKAADGERRSWLWALSAGALCAWAIWFKYPFAAFVLVILIGYWQLRWDYAQRAGGFRIITHPTAKRDAISFAAGLGGGILGGIGVMVAIGAWDALVQSASVTAGYTAISYDPDVFADAMGTGLYYRLLHWGLLFILMILLPIVAAQVKRRAIPHDQWEARRDEFAQPLDAKWGVPLAWLAIGFGIMLVQAKGYDYHWLPMLPPLVLFGAYTITSIIDLLRGSNDEDAGGIKWTDTPSVSPKVRADSRPPLHNKFDLLVGLLLLLVMIGVIWSKTLPYVSGREDQVTYYGRFQAGEFLADESLQVANFLQERVVAGDSLFIWGFRPEVYYMSRLNPAVRFIFHFPLVAEWYPPEWRDETVDILWAALPPYVLVLQVDYLDWVTGRSNADSNTLLQEYANLNDWLIFNYERETQIGNFFVWRRKEQ